MMYSKKIKSAKAFYFLYINFTCLFLPPLAVQNGTQQVDNISAGVCDLSIRSTKLPSEKGTNLNHLHFQ